ncbi:hypothetical protein CFOL_v3_28835 [Cephalotus follicularis]|uniref:Uncharacterized protein n=1 Tax=Cephalotus follicularis TaxID=3775 RepID=A0A1Q3CZ81_CEPFO|nr:hypothetical protein CFOL_v3_28835 [Cephalotus follicularis]
MEEVLSSSSSLSSTVISNIKKKCLSLTVSLQEGFRYVKAFFVGKAKKMTARNEKEASAADLETAKMQVEAADEAEDKKKKLNNSM